LAVFQLDNKAARRLFLDRHALAEQPSGPAKGDDLLTLIKRLGFVQLDSINTVARAHDMILYSRRATYRPKHLKRLYETDKALFEHWTHDAAMIPMAYYPHWQMRFRRDAATLKARWKNWRRDGFEEQFETVLRHVRDHGPVCSSDVGKDEKKGSGGWWDWHPAKTALEYLWRTGEIAVARRQGFQKVYDLSARVIPEPHYANEVSAEEFINWSCSTALDRLGFATPRDIAAFWDGITLDEVKTWVGRQEDKLVPVVVETSNGEDPRPCLAWHDYKTRMRDIKDAPSRLRVLSPFDPLLRDRERAERLFGFRYRIEVFVQIGRASCRERV